MHDVDLFNLAMDCFVFCKAGSFFYPVFRNRFFLPPSVKTFVRCDEQQIRQALINLIQNAVGLWKTIKGMMEVFRLVFGLMFIPILTVVLLRF